MTTIETGETITLEINKSKFISTAFNVCTTIEVEIKLAEIRRLFPDCTHVCYAYVLNGVEKCSDDGEPSGTAGKPILNVIQKNKLTNVLIVCVRYFGGIKLGAGPLTRAYSQSAVWHLNRQRPKNLKQCLKLVFTLLLTKLLKFMFCRARVCFRF